jgi:hypothetical protein
MTVESRLAALEERLRNLRNADRLQGRRLSAAQPSDGAVPVWNAAEAKWEPQTRPTRKMPMTLLTLPNGTTAGQMFFADGVTSALHASVAIPSDWVAGTDLTLVVYLHKGDAGSELAVMNSWISSIADTETWSWNIESSVAVNETMPASSEMQRKTRTIAAADVSADEVIEWFLQRVGNSGGDTLNESLFLDGVWLEYTASF